MAKIALFANDYVGLEITKFIIASGDTINKLYIHDPEKQKMVKEIIQASKCIPSDIVDAKDTNSPTKIKELKDVAPDFIITVYWAYLLKPEIFKIAPNTLNFHPALLPINRGWFPHVHSILDGTPTGVTLHQISAGADAGDIWVQKKIDLLPTDTAVTIYKRLQEGIIDLFKNNWGKIKKGEIKAFPQDKNKIIYHKKNEINQLDEIDLKKTYKGKNLINLLRARTFGEYGFAYFMDKNNEKVYLNLRLGRTPSFN